MEIELTKNGKRKTVTEKVGRILIKANIARLYETRQMEPDQTEQVEISALTGKPKRQYRRRDMQAEQ